MAKAILYTVSGAVHYRRKAGKPTTFPTIAKAAKSGAIATEDSIQVIDGTGKPLTLISKEALDSWSPRKRERSSKKIEVMLKLGLTAEQAQAVYDNVVRQKAPKTTSRRSS